MEKYGAILQEVWDNTVFQVMKAKINFKTMLITIMHRLQILILAAKMPESILMI